MKMRTAPRVSTVLFAVAAGLSLSACAGTTYTAKIRSRPETIAAGSRLPLHACLLISEATRAYQAHAHIPLGGYEYPFGRDLPDVALQTFQQAFDSASLVQDPNDPVCDLVITPTFDEAATHVDIAISTIHVVVSMDFEAANSSGLRWRKNFVGEMTTAGSFDAMETHGQAVSKAVAAAAVAMRAELASAKPRAQPGVTPAGAAWWAQ